MSIARYLYTELLQSTKGEQMSALQNRVDREGLRRGEGSDDDGEILAG